MDSKAEPAAFRAAYRAGVSKYYSPRLHAGFVFGGGHSPADHAHWPTTVTTTSRSPARARCS